jgi:hypothetical protein
VLCIGGRASGSDLAREISFFAKEVWLSDTTCSQVNTTQSDGCCSVTWVPKTIGVNEDGTVQFDSTSDVTTTKVKPDVIIFCSGYDYSFPFINERSNLVLRAERGERRVTPLYKQLWHAQYPNIAFIGLPHSVVPFPLMELQAEAVWEQLQLCTLPDESKRMDEAQKDSIRGGAKATGRIQDTHYLGDDQWEYCKEMAQLAGLYDNNETSEQVDAYISMNKAIYDCAGEARKDVLPGGADTYRSLIFRRDPTQKTFVVLDPSKEGVPASSTVSQ